MRVRKKLTIELKSDICIASGYSYAGLIDSDICYDEFGIPYIPGRRIKGCLRETAEKELHQLTKGSVDEIFGNSYDDGTKGIIVENAYLPDYEMLLGAFRKIQNSSEEKLKKLLSPQRVLDEYTAVKAQTRLDSDGVAEDKTLRFTRTLNRYNSEKQEMVFETYVTYESNEKAEEILPLVVSATKHIGLNRNRGLGNIKCSLGRDSVSELQNENADIQDPESVEASGDETWELIYTIQNKEPLMLSNMTDNTSETLIRGQSMLGLLASQYLKKTDNNGDSIEFRDLFLNGTTCFSDLVIARHGVPYFPAPLFIRKLKKSGKYVNIECDLDKGDFKEHELEAYSTESGNQPKKISGKYVHFRTGNKIDVAEVDRKLVFHHSHKGSNRYGGEAILYANEVVSEHQDFIGKITLPGKYVKQMMRLLIDADIRLGKSKTAQYGQCELTSLKPEKLTNVSHIKLNKGEVVAIVFLSDTFILYKNEETEKAHYTVFKDEVTEQIAVELEDLGIKCSRIKADNKCDDENDGENQSWPKNEAFIETLDISGYNTKLNMRKPTMQAIKAGSVIFYQLSEATTCMEGYVGEKNQEGYGHFAVMPLSEMKYKVDLLDSQETPKALTNDDIAPVGKLAKRALTDMLKDEIRLKAVTDVENSQCTLSLLNASTVGRVTLMLRESVNQYPDNMRDAFASFYSRVESIKKMEERKAVRKALLSKVSDPSERKDANEETITTWDLSSEKIRTLLKEAKDDVTLFDRIGGPSSQKEVDELVGLWSEYVMTALVYRKYQLAER